MVTKGKLPEETDPNVLAISQNLEFEAEDARFIAGTATTGTVPTIQSCSTSSNLLQVNLGTRTGNWIAFDNVVADAAGPYKMKVSYMTKVARSFRIRVNGTTMGRQLAAASGNWCYIDATNTSLGSPAIYEVVVMLKRGLNTLEIGLNNAEQAPFMDKIKLEKADINGLGLEAELAELSGTPAVVTCAVASNGAQVNVGALYSNGVRFNNLVSAAVKTYEVDIYYITKVQRNLRVFINGEASTTFTFDPSGNWCYETTPLVAKKTVQVVFAKGANSIGLFATGTDAPFIDKIVIREPVTSMARSGSQQEVVPSTLATVTPELQVANMFTVYPNPVQAGAAINVTLPGSVIAGSPLLLQITDVNGRIVFSKSLRKQSNSQLQVTNKLSSGLYLITLQQGQQRSSKKIVVQ